MNKFRAMLVDVIEGTLKEVEINDSLNEYYRLLNCDCIDITVRKIGGTMFDIVCDDEGLLKNNIIPSMFDDKIQMMLAGNLLICHNDGEGNLSGISDKDVRTIIDNSMIVSQADIDDDKFHIWNAVIGSYV